MYNQTVLLTGLYIQFFFFFINYGVKILFYALNFFSTFFYELLRLILTDFTKYLPNIYAECGRETARRLRQGQMI